MQKYPHDNRYAPANGMSPAGESAFLLLEEFLHSGNYRTSGWDEEP